jgi:hypothetical protein
VGSGTVLIIAVVTGALAPELLLDLARVIAGASGDAGP